MIEKLVVPVGDGFCLAQFAALSSVRATYHSHLRPCMSSSSPPGRSLGMLNVHPLQTETLLTVVHARTRFPERRVSLLWGNISVALVWIPFPSHPSVYPYHRSRDV